MEIFNSVPTLISTKSLSTIGLNTNSGTPESLNAGYYTVKITLTADNCQDRIVDYVMHIYNTMTSTLTYTVPALNQNKFSVEFDPNGKTITNDGSGYDSTTQGNLDFLASVTNPGTPVSDNGETFAGWDTDQNAATGSWEFSGTANPTPVLNDTTLYAIWTGSALTPISIAAIPGVTPPVAGDAPVAAITDTTQYTGTVTWSSSGGTLSGNFVAGNVYTATITLSAKLGYTFQGVGANFFTVAGANSVSNSINDYVITAVFPAAPQTINALTIPDVLAPVAGATSVKTFTSTQYNGTVVWNNSNPDTFAAGVAYTATITITPNSGYTLTGVGANAFTVAGVSATNVANTGVITAVFPSTAQTININAVPGVTKPVTGATPVTAITETTEYTGTVTWNGNPVTFASDTSYTATITLTPKTGYTLYGVGADFFAVVGTTTPATNAAGSGVITAIFPATDKTISIYTISGVDVPAVGATPVVAITETTEYTGTVTWNGNPSTFANNTAYTATITLTPKTGYTLTGVVANFFTVAGTATPATNAAGSGVITAVFPALGTGVVMSVTFTITDMGVVQSGDANVTPSDILNGSKSLTFTLSGTGYSGITWSLNGTPISGATTSALTIDDSFDLTNLLVTGKHILHAEGTKDTQPFNVNIEFILY